MTKLLAGFFVGIIIFVISALTLAVGYAVWDLFLTDTKWVLETLVTPLVLTILAIWGQNVYKKQAIYKEKSETYQKSLKGLKEILEQMRTKTERVKRQIKRQVPALSGKELDKQVHDHLFEKNKEETVKVYKDWYDKNIFDIIFYTSDRFKKAFLVLIGRVPFGGMDPMVLTLILFDELGKELGVSKKKRGVLDLVAFYSINMNVKEIKVLQASVKKRERVIRQLDQIDLDSEKILPILEELEKAEQQSQE